MPDFSRFSQVCFKGVILQHNSSTVHSESQVCCHKFTHKVVRIDLVTKIGSNHFVGEGPINEPRCRSFCFMNKRLDQSFRNLTSLYKWDLLCIIHQQNNLVNYVVKKSMLPTLSENFMTAIYRAQYTRTGRLMSSASHQPIWL